MSSTEDDVQTLQNRVVTGAELKTGASVQLRTSLQEATGHLMSRHSQNKKQNEERFRSDGSGRTQETLLVLVVQVKQLSQWD